MTRKLAKRKSEGASSPTPKQRKTAMSNQTRESSVSQEYEDEYHAGIFVGVEQEPIALKPAKKGKTGRKSEPARVLRAVEYAEDTGRSGSQNFLAAVAAGAKKKSKIAKETTEYIARVSQDIENEERDLKKRLQDLNSTSSNQDFEFFATFKKAFTSTYGTTGARKDDKNLRGAFLSNHRESQEIQKAAFQLVARFEEVAFQVSAQGQEPLVEKNWLEDEKQLEWILRKGKEHGEKKVESILSASKEPEMDRRTAKAVAIFYPETATSFDGWGKFAKKQAKSVERVIRKNLAEQA